MSKLSELLISLHACKEAREYCRQFETPIEAWEKCERGDWLLWFAGSLSIDRKVLVFAACQCARLALKHNTDSRVSKCIETAELWCRGAATNEELRQARRNAADAAYAADAAAAAAGAGAAADAYAAYAAYAAGADAADAAAYAAGADAADAAAYADAAYADAAKTETLKQCADLVHKHIAWNIVNQQITTWA